MLSVFYGAGAAAYEGDDEQTSARKLRFTNLPSTQEQAFESQFGLGELDFLFLFYLPNQVRQQTAIAKAGS